MLFEAYLRGIETGGGDCMTLYAFKFEAYLRGIETTPGTGIHHDAGRLKPT